MVYTSNMREGEPGFAFPEGCPKGGCERSEQARYINIGISLPFPAKRHQGRYDSVYFIPSPLSREGMKNTLSYLPW